MQLESDASPRRGPWWMWMILAWAWPLWPVLRVLGWPLLAVAGLVWLAPAWWRTTLHVVTQPGWRWIPILTFVLGFAGSAWRIANRWREGWGGSYRPAEREPITDRIPLFLHVAAVLSLSAAVAVAVGFGMWAVLGHPNLSGAEGAPATGWTVQNTFEAAKIVLTMVAGIGGVVALTVSYRKQAHGEAAENRENMKLFNERFGRAADQLGSDRAAVRLAGVYALAGLADDWPQGRRTCINVLCAYLRKPYEPPDAIHADGLTGDEVRSAHEERQVRHTVLSIIADRLLSELGTWHGHHFDLRGAVIDGAELPAIAIPEGTRLDFRGAHFTGGLVTFQFLRLSGGRVMFDEARFSGAAVSFLRARLMRGEMTFRDAVFTGGVVNFDQAKFEGGEVSFQGARFDGGEVRLDTAKFVSGTVDFSDPGSWAVPPSGVDRDAPGLLTPRQ